ncbi:hypothetical protein MUK42_11969 [Musa troglodytarum]|uniref:Uncharacterized protein n=1 Tax=Musa troglodytarum TaxID=320322 RepID=A0A9E7GMP2_9LILI|nr:hypothetical protein MUK42_11969 [Musa troglodytarum]
MLTATTTPPAPTTSLKPAPVAVAPGGAHAAGLAGPRTNRSRPSSSRARVPTRSAPTSLRAGWWAGAWWGSWWPRDRWR